MKVAPIFENEENQVKHNIRKYHVERANTRLMKVRMMMDMFQDKEYCERYNKIIQDTVNTLNPDFMDDQVVYKYVSLVEDIWNQVTNDIYNNMETEPRALDVVTCPPEHQEELSKTAEQVYKRYKQI